MDPFHHSVYINMKVIRECQLRRNKFFLKVRIILQVLY